jgi:hypothetical protein
LEGFKIAAATEAEERRARQARGELPIPLLESVPLQPQAKQIRLSPEDRRNRDDRLKADKTAKREADAVRLAGFKEDAATRKREREARDGHNLT